MLKDSVLALVEKLLEDVKALPADAVVDASALQAQLDAAKAALASDDAIVSADADQIAKLGAKLAAVKAALEA